MPAARPRSRTLRRRLALGALASALGLAGVPALGVAQAPADFRLTVLHNNDGESALLNAGDGLEDFGGAARFATVVDDLSRETNLAPDGPAARGVLTVSSGDNFLAGPVYNAGLRKGVPFYDTVAMGLIGYDAAAIGNHELDFGPDGLARFLAGFGRLPFLSANLDVSREPRLARLAGREGRIAPSVVVEKGGRQIGVIGLTTPTLPAVSSPRRVRVDDDVQAAAQEEIDRLTGQGVTVIVLISHLQDVEEERALVGRLSGVDIVVAGGGGELLANEGDLLLPEDEAEGPYPITATAADGAEVPIVTTSGGYRYVGRLTVDLDGAGRVVGVDEDSGPVRVSATGPDAVEPAPKIVQRVDEPVERAIARLGENTLARSAVALDGRTDAVRSEETNLGNLLSDAILFSARRAARERDLPMPRVVLQNGGGIRNDTVLGAGPFSELDTFSVAPFANFLALVPDVPPARLKQLVEHGVSEVGGGRFAQVAGMRVVYDPGRRAQEVSVEGDVTRAGQRVRELTLDDGTAVVRNGRVVRGAPRVSVATIDFLARNGDSYPFGGADFQVLGVSYQQALADYVESPAGLDGRIAGPRYARGGEGRIVAR